MRSSILLFMLLAMLWQSVPLARAGAAPSALADLAHAALHWQDEAHHHHEDGSYHLDDSPESVQHVVIDHFGAAAALLAASAHDVPLVVSAAPGSVHKGSGPEPDPEGLLRPPRSRS